MFVQCRDIFMKFGWFFFSRILFYVHARMCLLWTIIKLSRSILKMLKPTQPHNINHYFSFEPKNSFIPFHFKLKKYICLTRHINNKLFFKLKDSGVIRFNTGPKECRGVLIYLYIYAFGIINLCYVKI